MAGRHWAPVKPRVTVNNQRDGMMLFSMAVGGVIFILANIVGLYQG
ncbi:MAG: hypothetical protein AB7L09_22115 [Nitrospira sp.]